MYVCVLKSTTNDKDAEIDYPVLASVAEQHLPSFPSLASPQERRAPFSTQATGGCRVLGKIEAYWWILLCGWSLYVKVR